MTPLTPEESAEIRRRNAAAVAKINASRVEAGRCRHCDGPVPCWSESGDQAVGVYHTLKTVRAFHAQRAAAAEVKR